MAWAFSVMVISAFRYNLFSIAFGFKPKAIEKRISTANEVH